MTRWGCGGFSPPGALARTSRPATSRPPPPLLPMSSPCACGALHWVIDFERTTRRGRFIVGHWEGRCAECGAPGFGEIRVPVERPRLAGSPSAEYQRAYKDWLAEAEGGSFVDE